LCGILALADAARGNFVVLFNAENGCGRLKTGIATAWMGIGGAAFKVGMFQAGMHHVCSANKRRIRKSDLHVVMGKAV
jgi:hypothetical protein